MGLVTACSADTVQTEVVAAEVSGATVEEVAAALDVSHSTAKRRIAKARERLEILAKSSPDLERALAGGGGD